jgi:hypothetical protein
MIALIWNWVYRIMSYTLSWSPADQAQIQVEFMHLLNDPATGADAAQLGLELRVVAQGASSPQLSSPIVQSLTYPPSGTCSAYYKFESPPGTRMYVVGFCLTQDLSSFYATARGRAQNVP